MSCDVPFDLVIQRGVTFEGFILDCSDGEENPTDITGWTFESQARVRLNTEAAFSFTCAVEDGPAGQAQVQPMTPAQTMQLPLGKFGFDVVAMLPDGRRLPPLVTGTVKVEEIYTRPA